MIPKEPVEEPEKAEPEAASPEPEAAQDIESLKKALAEEKARAERHLANWQRAQADFLNYKRHSEQERAETSRMANASLMLSLLPVMADLERALAAVPPEAEEQPWVEGMRLIERKLRAALESQGLTEIKALGEPFDPRLHEAVMRAKGKEGVVVQELQKGYKLNDQLLRPSKVAVGNGEEDNEG
ncbi:MAG: nucleotide exchange factor GrpE [Chloroflexota bacterium]